MKLKLLLVLTISSALSLFADDLNDGFKEVDTLIDQKKYLSAINKVNELDGKYDDPQIIYYRVKATIDGFATSINHKMFGFKDLEPGEDIYEVRRNGGEFSIIMGDLQEDINLYLEQYPDSQYANEAAGNYYNDILLRYGDQLAFSYEDLYGLVQRHYLKAYENGSNNLKVVSEIGENSLYLGDLETGIKFYKIAISMKPQEPSFNYNLGFALIQSGENEKAIEYLSVAAEFYEKVNLKSDAYGLMGEANQKIGNSSKAIEYYKRSAEIYPQNYYSQASLLTLLFNEKKENEADELIQGFIMSNIGDFDALYKLINAYTQAQRSVILEKKMGELIEKTEGTIDEATIRFYLAQLMDLNGKDPDEEFLKAKAIYSEYLSEDHGILSYIDSLIGK